jgi:hypothetical protein
MILDTPLDVLRDIVACETALGVPGSGARPAVLRGQPGEISTRVTHRLHATCNQGSGDEGDGDAAQRRRPRGGRTAMPVLPITQASPGLGRSCPQ